jgi:DNA polymerase-1
MSHDELEADDLMHSLCVAEVEAGGTATSSPATATCSSARPTRCHVLMQRARQEGPTTWDPTRCSRPTASRPSRCPDFIALRGDPSDGLPGAKGIGAKTAADLLKRKGDLEHVILGAIREKPSVRRALIEQADELRSFRDIATLRTVALDRPATARRTTRAARPRPRARHGPARQAPAGRRGR